MKETTNETHSKLGTIFNSVYRGCRSILITGIGGIMSHLETAETFGKVSQALRIITDELCSRIVQMVLDKQRERWKARQPVYDSATWTGRPPVVETLTAPPVVETD